MRAVRLTHWGAPAVLTDVERPSPSGEEVLIRVEAAGLCGSDLHVLGARPGTLPYAPPFTLGHEVAGRVVERGPDAVGPRIGERVVVYGPWGCGRCGRCAVGAENYCDRRAALDAARAGTGAGLGRDGGLADFLLVPSGRLLLPVGDLDPAQAAPLSDAGLTSYHAVAGLRPTPGGDRSGGRNGGRNGGENGGGTGGTGGTGGPGSTGGDVDGANVVVIGVGGLGHLAVQILRAITSARVLAVDVREEAIALADECGAHFGTVVRADTADALRKRTGDAGVDAVLDFVGTSATLGLGLSVLRAGGALSLVGSGGGELTVRKPGALPPGLRISLPFWGTRPDLEQVVALARSGAVRVATERFPLSRAPEAIDALRSGRVRGRAVLIPG
ncbi:alcohol dehydrogenase catalytic domain-containing protein [Streptomyces phaeolivaceus]|uniref:alcohol dehydrogenase n=1 Tax=Streptomyces phaeolivaceus TaxID=2653200 RepID=A0A5P8JVR6_9ACTN|nr:alcohol dehydrogenase catalytic domain-containing protein [Streptomyces phaeolivaceus]QFQ95093.1 alcohol dehydrogenase catalytic domain-containing protein [Streptomyces phaeolivaceus]